MQHSLLINSSSALWNLSVYKRKTIEQIIIPKGSITTLPSERPQLTSSEGCEEHDTEL